MRQHEFSPRKKLGWLSDAHMQKRAENRAERVDYVGFSPPLSTLPVVWSQLSDACDHENLHDFREKLDCIKACEKWK